MLRARPRNVLRWPRLWLLVGAAAFLGIAVSSWNLGLVTYESDSTEFQTALDGPSLGEVLAGRRTLGYPLVVAATRLATGSVRALPYVHLAIYALAAVAFGLAAGAFLGSDWVGLLAATPLFFSPFVREWAPALLADVVAGALGLLTLALLLLLVVRRRRVALWVGLGAALAAAYQMRPAYLFLVPLVPALGFVLFPLRSPGAGLRRSASFAAGLSALALGPFLLFCALRWSVTGHFGLVAFGGHNVLGIASSMLTAEALPLLPAEHRPLAESILARREQVGVEVPTRYDHWRWQTLYLRNIWRIGVPAARRTPGLRELRGDAFEVASNRAFSGLSWALIRLRPGLYARWIGDSLAWSALRIVTRQPEIPWLALAVLVSWPVSAWVRRRRLRGARVRDRRLGEDLPEPAAGRAALGFALAGLAYTIASMLLIVLVEPPVDRYIFAAALPVPSALAGLAAHAWRRAFVAAAPYASP